MRDIGSFTASLDAETPPQGISVYLQALWYDGKNDWEKAHTIAQEIQDHDGAWIHAYLHRKEGDPGNARYWYNRAGRPVPAITLAKEWEELVLHFLRPGK